MIRKTLSRSLLPLVVAFSLNACSTYKMVPVGTIPPVEPPTSAKIEESHGMVLGMLHHEGFKMDNKGPEFVRLSNIYKKLNKAIGQEKPLWPIHLVDANGEINAAAINQGTIVVYKDLLTRIKNDAELAAIVAHEMGHILAKHSNDGEEDKLQTVSIASSIFGSIASVAASVAGVGYGAADSLGDLTATATAYVGVGAWVQQYNRDQEYEADQIGLMIMSKAGFDPKEAVGFWKRAHEVFGDEHGSSFLSTHPSNEDRADALSEALPAAEAYFTQAKAKSATTPATAKKSVKIKKA
jgi:metalloendopeptidase OMA1, mitochondrial